MINGAFSFVDLPGYGYAKVPAAVKKTWGPMIEKYLTLRDNLKGIISLLDIRRTPGPEEKDLMGWLALNRIPCVWVLTKADKFSKMKQKNRQLAIGDTMGLAPEKLILFSAKTRLGRDAVLAEIQSLCAGKPGSIKGKIKPADSILRVDDKE